MPDEFKWYVTETWNTGGLITVAVRNNHRRYDNTRWFGRTRRTWRLNHLRRKACRKAARWNRHAGWAYENVKDGDCE